MGRQKETEMDATALAILAVTLIFTIALWAMVIFMGKRSTWVLVFTLAMTLVTVLVILNVYGTIDIWPILAPAAPAVTP